MIKRTGQSCESRSTPRSSSRSAVFMAICASGMPASTSVSLIFWYVALSVLFFGWA